MAKLRICSMAEAISIRILDHYGDGKWSKYHSIDKGKAMECTVNDENGNAGVDIEVQGKKDQSVKDYYFRNESRVVFPRDPKVGHPFIGPDETDDQCRPVACDEDVGGSGQAI